MNSGIRIPTTKIETCSFTHGKFSFSRVMRGAKDPVFSLNLNLKDTVVSFDERFDSALEMDKVDFFELFMAMKYIFEKTSVSSRLFQKEYHSESTKMDVKPEKYEVSEVEVLLEDDELRNQAFSLTVNPYSNVITLRSQGFTVDTIRPEDMKDEIDIQSKILNKFRLVLDNVSQGLSGGGRFCFNAETVFEVGSV